MPTKLRYEIDLSHLTSVDPPPNLRVRPISRDDLDGLASLMLDAYMGTIDYEGEDLEDAVQEVRSFLDDPHTLMDRSFAVDDEGAIVSAVLVSLSAGEPFIGYVMTRASHKNQGLARLVTNTALEKLADDDHERVVFYITDGNAPSEALFDSLGAVRVDS